MMTAAKLLVIGPPDGPQGQFVSAISEVKVRSSARTTSGQETVPMDFGRVRLGIDLDLQLFGFERDRVSLVSDAVSPGIVGAVMIVGPGDFEDPHFAAQALDELAARGIPAVVAVDALAADPGSVKAALNGSDQTPIVHYKMLDKESVKSIVVAALEAAMQAAEGSAA